LRNPFWRFLALFLPTPRFPFLHLSSSPPLCAFSFPFLSFFLTVVLEFIFPANSFALTGRPFILSISRSLVSFYQLVLSRAQLLFFPTSVPLHMPLVCPHLHDTSLFAFFPPHLLPIFPSQLKIFDFPFSALSPENLIKPFVGNVLFVFSSTTLVSLVKLWSRPALFIFLYPSPFSDASEPGPSRTPFQPAATMWFPLSRRFAQLRFQQFPLFPPSWADLALILGRQRVFLLTVPIGTFFPFCTF